MMLDLPISPALVESLRQRLPSVDRAALEGLALRAIGTGLCLWPRFGKLLGFASRWEAQDFLASFGSWPDYDPETLATELAPDRGMTVVISDTSVLSYPALIDQLSLLESIFTQVVIPEAVLHECLHPEAPEELRSALLPAPPRFVTIVRVEALLPETAALDAGEKAAMSHAWHCRTNSLLLLDERQGRSVAMALGLRLVGTLGITMEGHRRGLLDFNDIMGRLRQHGFRIADDLLVRARAELGIQS